MKKITLIVFSILLLASCTTSNKDVQITGKVENAKTESIVFIVDGERDTVKFGEEGMFAYSYLAEKPVYATARLGRELIRLYIEPGKDFSFNFDGENIAETLVFEGDGAVTNNYLASIAKLEKEVDVNFRVLYAKEPADFIHTSDSIIKLKKDFFASYLEQAEVSDVFKNGEKSRLYYAWANEREIYPRYYAYLNKTEEPVLAEDYYAYREKLNVDDASLLNISDYQQYLSSALGAAVSKAFEANPELEDEDNAYYTTNFEQVSEVFANQEVRDYMLNQVMGDIVSYMNLDLVPDFIEKFNELCTNEEYKEKVAANFAAWEPLTKGKPAYNFTYESINGEMVSLSDFKGKYVYIDVWATWCGPCLREVPHLKALEEELHDKNIVFMSVSIDDPKDKEKWSTMVHEKEMRGVQLFADAAWQSAIAKENKINGIPRFMLIDMDGNFVNVKASRPSGNIKEVILALEGI